VLHVLAIEPYCGGSHRAFVDGYRAHSAHRVELLTMPARKWKWRMRGAAILMADRLAGRQPDILLVSDYLDLAAMMGVLPKPVCATPRVAYFHENQLTYPLPDEADRDYQYGFTNITTCLCAQRVLFNSRYHRESFLDAVDALLGRMPDCVPEGVSERIRERSLVVPVGVDLEAIDRVRARAAPRDGPLRVLWNHRWEFDKAPDAFFEVAERLDRAGCDFELVVIGRSFRAHPAAFDRARERLAHRLRTFGYVESREDYVRHLLESDVVVSTAIHEFFGVAVVEAVYAGCVPLLPNRLSYPELLPEHLHDLCFYDAQDELYGKLCDWTRRPERIRSMDLRDEVARFGWAHVAPSLDAVMARVAAGA